VAAANEIETKDKLSAVLVSTTVESQPDDAELRVITTDISNDNTSIHG
jgi:hypothetical protein